MNPRAIALQGIGFGVAMVALQGFAVVALDEHANYYGAGEEPSQRRGFIARQNHTLLHLLAAFTTTGEI